MLLEIMTGLYLTSASMISYKQICYFRGKSDLSLVLFSTVYGPLRHRYDMNVLGKPFWIMFGSAPVFAASRMVQSMKQKKMRNIDLTGEIN